MYAEGITIKEIAAKTNLTEEDVHNHILEYKRTQTMDKRGKYNYKLAEIITKRWLSGYTINQIKTEIQINHVTASRLIRECGYKDYISRGRKWNNVDKKKQKALEESKEIFESIGDELTKINWKSFDQCPTCKSTKRINKVNLTRSSDYKGRSQNSYCVECGTEWLERNNKVYKVNWEYIS